MKALNKVLLVVACLTPGFSFAASCLDGFSQRATFGEIVSIELDFGDRMVPNNSKCTPNFIVSYSNIIQASCQVCGAAVAEGNQFIGIRKVLGKQTTRHESSMSLGRPHYTYDIYLEAKTMGNPLTMSCTNLYDDVSRLDNNQTADIVVAALKNAKISCSKARERKSCF